MITTATIDIADNRLRQAGVTTHRPADRPAFDAALAGFNLSVAHRPDLVVTATSTDDVQATMTTAHNLGLPVRVLGHGHGVRAAITEGIAISTLPMARVEMDPGTRTARVGAGTTWQQVIDAASPHGLAPICGSAPAVGVVGFLLGGGVGPVSRTYGFGSDHVCSFEVVTDAGDLITVDRRQHADLFWALRGGKTGFGVVTEVTIDLVKIRTLYGGGLWFSADDAAPVMRAFAAWSATVPEQVTTSAAVLRLPPDPDLPELLRGQTVVHVRVAVVGDADRGADLVEPMRSAAAAVLDTVAEMPYAAIGSIHADPVSPMAVVEGGILLSAFDDGAVHAFLAAVGPAAPVPLAMVEIRRLGGAMAREPEVGSAVGGRDAAYGLFVVGAPVPELSASMPYVIRGVFDALSPWATGGSQVNFFGSANTPESYENCWPAEVSERLSTVRNTHA